MKVKTQPCNSLANTVELFIYDDICSYDAPYYVAAIRNAGDQQILLRINSMGGSVFAGYAIYNALSAHKAGVIAQIDGIAASTASWVALAARSVRMFDNAFFVIHRPSICSAGDAEQLRKDADLLDKCQVSIVAAYCKKTGLPEEQINALMDDETWLSAEDAKAFGFVDEVLVGGPESDITNIAKIDTAKFKKAPQNLINRIDQKMKLRADLLNLLKPADANITDDALVLEVSNRLSSLTGLKEIQDKLATAEGEVVNLKAQFATATTTATDLQNKLTVATGDLTTKTSKLLDVENKLTVAGDNVTRLEQLCGINGIDPKNAVKAEVRNESTKTIAQYTEEMNAAKSPAQRLAISKQIENALAAGRVS